MSDTKLPASLIVSLSNCIMGESFIDTHSKPLEAVGLDDLSDSVRPLNSESTDLDLRFNFVSSISST